MSLRLPEEEYSILINNVFSRDNWKCRSCGFRGNLHAHHLRFRSQGGEDSTKNLVTLCASCHDGLHRAQGLRIVGGNANAELTFIREAWWKPS